MGFSSFHSAITGYIVTFPNTFVKDNIPIIFYVSSTLSKELVAEIDKDAKENFRTRSQQINMILTEYYKTKTTTNHASE